MQMRGEMGFRVWGVNAKQLGAVSFFIVTSIAAILLNKALFKNFNFPCPMLTTAIQFTIALIIMVGIHVFGKYVPEYAAIPNLALKVDVAISVFPVSVLFICMVCFNNWFLMNVGVGFYAIGKSLSIPMTVVLTFVFLGQITSASTIGACLLISFGIFLGSAADADLSFSGLLLGALSSVFTSGYQIFVKKGLNTLNGDQWLLGWYNAWWCVLVLVPFGFWMGEGGPAMEALVSTTTGEVNWSLVTALGVSGIIGFLIGQATYMSIHHTSALAHHVSGVFKSCLQTFLGVLVWREPQTLMSVSALLCTLGGSYSFMRSRMGAAAAPTAADPPKSTVPTTEGNNKGANMV